MTPALRRQTRAKWIAWCRDDGLLDVTPHGQRSVARHHAGVLVWEAQEITRKRLDVDLLRIQSGEIVETRHFSRDHEEDDAFWDCEASPPQRRARSILAMPPTVRDRRRGYRTRCSPSSNCALIS